MIENGGLEVTASRRWTQEAFERACRLTGLDNRELCVRLAAVAGRSGPLAAQTLFDWRRGINAVPFEIFAAACYLARVDPRAVIGLIGIPPYDNSLEIAN